MNLTFFGDLANHPEILMAYENRSHRAVVLTIQNVQIREYRGRQGSTMRNTYVMVNSSDPEAVEMLDWYEREGSVTKFEGLSEVGAQTGAGSSYSGSQTISVSYEAICSF